MTEKSLCHKHVQTEEIIGISRLDKQVQTQKSVGNCEITMENEIKVSNIKFYQILAQSGPNSD